MLKPENRTHQIHFSATLSIKDTLKTTDHLISSAIIDSKGQINLDPELKLDNLPYYYRGGYLNIVPPKFQILFYQRGFELDLSQNFMTENKAPKKNPDGTITEPPKKIWIRSFLDDTHNKIFIGILSTKYEPDH